MALWEAEGEWRMRSDGGEVPGVRVAAKAGPAVLGGDRKKGATDISEYT